jgi:DNA mismatch endonuclease (patch repair protein)
MDTVSSEKRSEIMSHIRGKNTKPEVAVRSWLHRAGFRFRKNDKRYPGKPDVVLPKYKTVMFVNGCFWHHHEGCKGATVPKSNTGFWEEKFARNRERDARNVAALEADGWRVVTIWECELKKKTFEATMVRVADEIRGGRQDEAPTETTEASGTESPDSNTSARA